MHVKWSLFLVQALPGYPVPGKDNCSFPLANLPQLGVLASQGQVGEAPLIVQQLPPGWES